MTPKPSRRFARAANDNISPLKIALRDWADRERMVRGNTKTLLRALASHAAEDGTVFISRNYFADLIGVRVRAITDCTRRLENEGLIEPTDALVIIPSVAYPVYLLAPHEDGIQALIRAATPGVDDRLGGSRGRSCGNRATYKDNSTDTKFLETPTFPQPALSDFNPSDLEPVPQQIREALSAALNADQMFSYVDQARWNPRTRSLHPQHKAGYTVLSDKCAVVANDVAFTIGAPIKSAPHG